MDEFEKLLNEHRAAVERFVKFKIQSVHDADDILQDVFLTAHQKFKTLKDKSSFKAWCVSIARNKCTDYYRRKARLMSIPISSLSETVLSVNRHGISERLAVRESLDSLGDKDKQILYLYFFKELTQEEISERLNIPIGTVKSRLHNAKEKFRRIYPYPHKANQSKGECVMKKLPDILPEYKLTALTDPPFPVVFEELSNWFIIPRTGEEVTWGSYDMPKRNIAEEVRSKVVCPVNIHGVEGVEIQTSSKSTEEGSYDHIYYAQLTDTHCRWLGESYIKNGVRHLLTFLDGDDFISQWGFGEDNCGYETHLSPKGDVTREGNRVSAVNKEYLFDVVGRYSVEIGSKTYDTVCIMEICKNGVATEQFVDKNGKTVLWRRFNRDDWAYERRQKKWTEILPDNEQLLVNGETYVHWYDCVTDYIF